MLTIVARPVPARSSSATKRSTTAGRMCVSGEVAEVRQDPQFEVDRVALLRGECEPTLDVVGPPLAVDVFAQRDLVGEHGGVAGLLEPPHAAVEVAGVVFDVEGAAAVGAAAAGFAPADDVGDGAVGARLAVDAHAAPCPRRAAFTRARSVSLLGAPAGGEREWA